MADTAEAHETIWAPQAGPQKALVDCPVPEILYGGARGGGKGSPRDSQVLTPFGFRRMGDLAIGDMITDPTTGGHQTVVGIYPQGERDVYRLTFDDGASIEVDDQHLWACRVANRRRPGKAKRSEQRVFARAELGASEPVSRFTNYRVTPMRDVLQAHQAGHSVRVPLTEPVGFERNGRTGKGAMPAYLVGLLLGDGSLPTQKITTGDAEIADYLRRQGFSDYADANEFGARGSIGRIVRRWLNNHGLAQARSADKFLPAYILTAPMAYRLDVLRGLLDADGTIDGRGRVYFCSVSWALAEGVQALVRGLGGKARLRERQTGYTYADETRPGQPSYNVRIWHPKTSALFGLTRKRERATDSWNGGHEITRELVACEHVSRKPTQCIAVSGPFGLYVGDDYIVTHNTDGVLGKLAILGERHGSAFNALICRREATGFDDMVERSHQILGPLGWRYTAGRGAGQWRSPRGARIRFRPLDRTQDAEKYQGQNITHAVVEEAGQYPDSAPIDRLNGVLRSASGVPTQLILTANPGGPGQQWIKQRFIDPAPGGFTVLRQALPNGNIHKRVYIPARVEHNKQLLRFDPEYINRLYLVGSSELVRAWLEGDWSAVEGAFFDEWRSDRHIVRPFAVPEHWTKFRAMDWGSARPFSVGWYAIASETYHHKDGHRIPRGALVKYREWYGCDANQANVGLKLTAEDVARGIVQRERHDRGIKYSVLDPAAFAEDGGPSLAERMYRASHGQVRWRPADNARVGQRGRMGGWDQVRQRLRGEDDVPMLYFFSTCTDTIRTIPMLQHDDARPEDLDTESEDHAADELRYACMSRPMAAPTPKPRRPSPNARRPTLNEALAADDRVRMKGEDKI